MEIRFLFYKKPPKDQSVTLILADYSLRIPPETSNHESQLFHRMKKTLLLQEMSMHMHLRGKANSMSILGPGAPIKRIFNLDPWNFSFQRAYNFKKPILVLKGSLLQCTNWFDNSAENVVNPDSNKTVVWGLTAEHEMSECFFGFTLPSSAEDNF